MHLKYCSITGADDEIDVEDLSVLAEKYPFAECAILLLPASAGKPRFPTAKWIENFARKYRGRHPAMHLCGQALLDFIAKKPEILGLMSGFRRIQLNLKFGDVEGKYKPAELAARVKEFPKWEFILQYAKDKKNILPLFTNVLNHAVLFDESAGRGISPDKWDPPLSGRFCGYAGGITPDNVAKNLKILSRIAIGKTIWIDMESGIRTHDKFDLDKVRRVLEIAAPYAVRVYKNENLA
jgi:phosphoribosylanthranilate isomerase